MPPTVCPVTGETYVTRVRGSIPRYHQSNTSKIASIVLQALF